MSGRPRSAPGMPKLLTCRLAAPAPRSSTGTSLAGGGGTAGAVAGAGRGSANRPPARPVTVDLGVARAGRRSRSARRTRSAARPASSVSPSHGSTSTEPDERQHEHLSRPVANSRLRPARARARAGPSSPSPPTRGVDSDGPAVAAARAGAQATSRRWSRTGSSAHHLDGGVDRRGDVAVRRVEQGPADHQAPHAGSARAFATGERVVRVGLTGRRRAAASGSVVAAMTRSMSSTTGSFSQV